MEKRRIAKILPIYLAVVLILCSCSSNRNSKEEMEAEKIILTLAVFDDNAELRGQVAFFNQNQEKYQIEIQEYKRSTQFEEDGLLRLQREIALGKGPDMIDFGADYATSDIVGMYTENLLPYMEKEGTEKYFFNIIEAFCYKEGLYALPSNFKLETFAGSRNMIGDRAHWNIQEMIECYQDQEQGVMLYPGQTKKDVFGTILTGSIEYYIDWEAGTCEFNGTEFKKVMEFCNLFPEKLIISDDFSVKQTFLDGKALLLNMRLSHIYDICKAEHIFDEREIVYIGFPVDGVCGTVIKPCNSVLAISRNSKYKDISWQFIEQYLENQSQKENTAGFTICRNALKEKITRAQMIEYTTDSDGNQNPVAKQQILFEGEEPVDIYAITEAQGRKLLDLIESAEVSISADDKLYEILLEEADSYFSGDKCIEEVTDIIQNKALIYISERVN